MMASQRGVLCLRVSKARVNGIGRLGSDPSRHGSGNRMGGIARIHMISTAKLQWQPTVYPYLRASRSLIQNRAGHMTQHSFQNILKCHNRQLGSTADTSKLEQEFHQTIQRMKDAKLGKPISNEKKLKIYGLYKTATSGLCTGERPGIFSPVERAKYDSWKALESLDKVEAMRQYITIVANILGSQHGSDLGTRSSGENEQSADLNTFMLQQIGFSQTIEKGHFRAIGLETIQTSCESGVARLVLNRPTRGNSFNMAMWRDLNTAYGCLNRDSDCRVVILSGSAPNFSTGMDLEVFSAMQPVLSAESCEGRRREALGNVIRYLQESISLPETCRIPTIAVVSGNCIGGAVDLISACDMVYCTENATFCIKETDLAMVADIGTLQRLPKLIGLQRCRELAYTGRTFSGKQAKEYGLVVDCFPTAAELEAHVTTVAKTIAVKSPLTIRGIKRSTLFSRDHNVKDSLEHIELWNSAHLYSDDLQRAFVGVLTKKSPEFPGH